MQQQYTAKDIARFWSKVDCTAGLFECWLWTADKSPEMGYGHIKIKGKTMQAHRLVWELLNGPIPNGMCVCHTCDNGSCCNPSHLWIGTIADNNHDRSAKGRTTRTGPKHPSRGEKHPSHKISDAQVEEIRSIHAQKTMTQCAMAVKFGVSTTLISYIVNQKVHVSK